jgi:hypothetical protein
LVRTTTERPGYSTYPYSQSKFEEATNWLTQAIAIGRKLSSVADESDVIAVESNNDVLLGADRWPTALSGLRSISSGAPYTPALGSKDSAIEFRRREDLVNAFFSRPDSAGIDSLCSLGVDWVWTNSKLPETLSSRVKKEISGSAIQLYRIRC